MKEMNYKILKHSRLAIRGALCATIALSIVCPVIGQDSGTFSGSVFGDYYNVSDHHDSAIDGKNGFWFRRIYLTYDRKLADKFQARVRFEAASPGDFTSSNKLDTILKDVYVRYSGSNCQVILGLQPAPTFSNIEDFHGYRAVEKTPHDLWKIADSRDTGIAVKGTIDKEKKIGYWAMFGNDSGTSAETNKGKAYYLGVNAKLPGGFYAEVYGDYRDKEGPNDWTTLSGFLGYKNETVDVGVIYAHQNREMSMGSDVNLSVLSFYGALRTSKDVKPFIRVDRLSRAVPNASSISYLPVSGDATPTLVIVGVNFALAENVFLIPNIEWVSYRNPVPPATKPGDDILFRLTFEYFWK
jgi:hypothetical protein